MPIIVTAAIIEQNGKWFIARRKPKKKMGGLWEFPGGKLELGESPEACLQRELREELGIETQIGVLLADAYFVFEGNTYQIIAYSTLHLSGNMALTDHDDCAWVLPNDLPQYALTPADADIVAQLLNPSRIGS